MTSLADSPHLLDEFFRQTHSLIRETDYDEDDDQLDDMDDSNLVIPWLEFHISTFFFKKSVHANLASSE